MNDKNIDSEGTDSEDLSDDSVSKIVLLMEKKASSLIKDTARVIIPLPALTLMALGK
jgi:hypothetical protein